MVQAYVQTAVVGGTKGVLFDDVYYDNSGEFILNDNKRDTLNKQSPIRAIKVSFGSIVDGIAIDYVGANKIVTTVAHGSQFPNANVVTIGDHETLIGVFGRAGYQRKYKRDHINSIGFTILDNRNATVRIAGPFGNIDHTNDGKVFSASDVVAFGGFSDDNAPKYGLSGLFFIKTMDSQ